MISRREEYLTQSGHHKTYATHKQKLKQETIIRTRSTNSHNPNWKTKQIKTKQYKTIKYSTNNRAIKQTIKKTNKQTNINTYKQNVSRHKETQHASARHGAVVAN
jgi:hypothetical protein